MAACLNNRLMLFEKSIEALAQKVNKAIKTLFQGEGELFAICLKIRTTGLAGQLSAKPEPDGGYFLSWGRG